MQTLAKSQFRVHNFSEIRRPKSRNKSVFGTAEFEMGCPGIWIYFFLHVCEYFWENLKKHLIFSRFRTLETVSAHMDRSSEFTAFCCQNIDF